MFSKKGLMDKKVKKTMQFCKGRQKEQTKENRIGRKEGF